MIGYGLNNKSRKISSFENFKNPLFINKIIVYKISLKLYIFFSYLHNKRALYLHLVHLMSIILLEKWQVRMRRNAKTVDCNRSGVRIPLSLKVQKHSVLQGQPLFKMIFWVLLDALYVFIKKCYKVCLFK
jgi:hypothetical protein